MGTEVSRKPYEGLETVRQRAKLPPDHVKHD